MVSKKLATIILFLGIVLIAGCTNAETGENETQVPETTSPENAAKEESAAYTKKMIAEHDQPQDCWVIVEGGVYDITSLIGQMAGQGTIESCGRTMDILLIKEKLGLENLQEARGRLQDFYLEELN